MNLLTNPIALDLWTYRPAGSNGYTIQKDKAVNPFGTSNLADLVIPDVESYGGISQLVVLQPNTTYYFSIWSYIPINTNGVICFAINQTNMGFIYWNGTATPGISSTAAWVTPTRSTVNNPTPWQQYKWTFTTPSTVDNTAPCTFRINLSGSNTGNLANIFFWGADLDTTNTAFTELSTYIYPVDSLINNDLVFLPSIDYLDNQGLLTTIPFDPSRYSTVNYNLIPYPASYNLNYWTYRKSNQLITPPFNGYTIHPGLVSNPFNTSSLTTLISGDTGSYGGISLSQRLQPNTTYTLSFWAYGPTINSATFTLQCRLYSNILLGTSSVIYWDGPANPIGYATTYGTYAYPPKSVNGSTPWTKYVWTFTTPGNIDTAPGFNNIFSLEPGGLSDIMVYGFSLVKGNTAQEYIEPQSFSFDINTLPAGNTIVVDDFSTNQHLPSIDLFDSFGDMLTNLFDPLRLYTFSHLGKYAIPYGNTFDRLINNVYQYNIDTANGVQILGNLEDAPIDAINNPVATAKAADLLTMSSDPKLLATHPGGGISWPSLIALKQGTTYTISCWLKAKYLTLNMGFNIDPGGNYVNGIQASGSEGNLSSPAWKTLNGSFNIIATSVTAFQGTSNDMGIPNMLDPADQLFTKRGDHIRAVPGHGIGLGPCVTYSDPTVFDIVTTPDNLLSADALACKYATFLYQEVLYTPDVVGSLPQSSSPSTYNIEFWSRVGNEYTYLDGAGTTQYAVNPHVVGNIAGWGLQFTLTDGSTRLVIIHNWNILDTDNWRQQSSSFYTNFSVSAADQALGIKQDYTIPIKVGIFFTGDLIIYGGFRIYDNNSRRIPYLTIYSDHWVRASFSFVACETMQAIKHVDIATGTSNPVRINYTGNTINIQAFQPVNPVGNTTMLPWAPKFSAFYLYGLMINEGVTPDVYYPDLSSPIIYAVDTIKSTNKIGVPYITLSGDIEVKTTAIKSKSESPDHQVGINVASTSWYSYDRMFLNLWKFSSCGPFKIITDPTGVFPPSENPFAIWFCYRTISVSHIDTSWNTFGTRTKLTFVIGQSGGTTIYTWMNHGDNWWNYRPTALDRTIVGIGFAPGTKVIDRTVSDQTLYPQRIEWTLDTPMIANSPLWQHILDNNGAWFDWSVENTLTQYIKNETIDHLTDFNTDSDGYPRVIPTGYVLWGMAYRNTPPYNFGCGMLNNPIMPSTQYVLKWDGEGVIELGGDTALTPDGYPATLVSRSANRAVYQVDCSGNTIDGMSVHQKYALATDTPTPLAANSRCGFKILIRSTDPNGTGNYVRNIRLCELEQEANLDAGKIFYQLFLDRLKHYKCIRFLNWNNGGALDHNTVANLTPITAVSYAGGVTCVPMEIIIALCNETQKDCWVNIEAGGTPDYYLYVAKVFESLLDPKLRLYIEYSNEQWNGGMKGSWWMSAYATKYNIKGLVANSPNPGWDAHMYVYAMKSMECFNVFRSVFSSIKGKLEPVRLWDNPKTQRKRLMCMLSTKSMSTIANDIYNYGKIWASSNYGIPYDGIASTGYYDDMLNWPYISNLEMLAKPGYYPWTVAELIGPCWGQLAEYQAKEYAGDSQLYLPTPAYPDGPLGRDDDGDLHHPTVCFYEGGFGSPGPTPYLLKAMIQIKFEEDGLRTLYNMTKSQMAWWHNTMVPLANGDDAVVYNIYQLSETYSTPDQWGITDKGLYNETEYYSFPLPLALAEGANLQPFPIVTVPIYTGPTYASKPKVWDVINLQWVDISNIKIANTNGIFIDAAASTIQYEGNATWV